MPVDFGVRAPIMIVDWSDLGLHLVRVRSEYLQRACSDTKGGLVIVHLNRESRLTEAMFAAKQFCVEKLGIDQPVCDISTYLFTECRIVGGHIEVVANKDIIGLS